MIVRLASLNFLLLFFCRRITQADLLEDIVTDIRSREPLQIRTDFDSNCNYVTTPPPPLPTTTTAKPTTIKTKRHDDCTNSVVLETTTQKLFQSYIAAPPRDTLEDINSYCKLLENAFQLTEEPPETISKYHNNIELHFVDNPLLKPAPEAPIVKKPCRKDISITKTREVKAPIIYTPPRPKCTHKHEVKPKVPNLYNLFSVLSSATIKPTFKNKCPHDVNSTCAECQINENVESPINEKQKELYDYLRFRNYPNLDYNYWNAPPHPVMQNANLAPQNSEYHKPISRFVRNTPYTNEYGSLRFVDEVSERLPIEDPFSVNDRIIGGTKTKSQDTPYQVALYKLDYFICGSSLISEFYILTAGHCLDNIIVKHLWFRVGSEYLMKGGETYKVSDYSIHPDYNTTDFDIAIIRSARAIEFGTTIQPIALPSFADSDLPENVKVMGSGWGATERSNNKKATYSLHKITLLTVNREKCRNRIMASKNEISRRQICTNLPTKAGMCFGDSGGPLVGNKKLVGIVSWGSPCAIGDADVYTNVRVFLPWIYCTMKKLDHKHWNN